MTLNQKFLKKLQSIKKIKKAKIKKIELRKNKNDVPIVEFRKECRDFANKWIDVHKKQFQRLGVIGDWKDYYSTMSFKAEAQIVRELANILLMCAMGSILFLGGWLTPLNFFPFDQISSPIWLIFKILFLFILFALVKAIVPRYRYDQLMKLGWKIFLPFSLIWVVITASYLFYFNLLPTN